jgi:predicted DNA binding CopG/RHH family protein
MNYYNEIKNKLIDNEIYEKVKDYSKEKNKVITYFEIGELLSKAGKEYEKNTTKTNIRRYSIIPKRIR